MASACITFLYYIFLFNHCIVRSMSATRRQGRRLPAAAALNGQCVMTTILRSCCNYCLLVLFYYTTGRQSFIQQRITQPVSWLVSRPVKYFTQCDCYGRDRLLTAIILWITRRADACSIDILYDIVTLFVMYGGKRNEIIAPLFFIQSALIAAAASQRYVCVLCDDAVLLRGSNHVLFTGRHSR